MAYGHRRGHCLSGQVLYTHRSVNYPNLAIAWHGKAIAIGFGQFESQFLGEQQYNKTTKKNS